MLKALYNTDGGSVSYADLATDIRWDDQESLRGVLGAFGRRINETDAISADPGIEAFVEKRRTDGSLQYRLRSEARRAIEDVDPLMQKFESDMETLLEPGTTIEADALDG